MTKKSIALGMLGIAVAGAIAYSTKALAYGGDPNQKGPNYTPERHEQMDQAFESNDYNAWKSLMNGRGRVSEVINESNFNRFAEIHKLMEEGKTDEANKIRQELGLRQGSKNVQGNGNGQGQRGQSKNGNFVDANGDGKCDRMQ
ncbi:MAG: hypothetical protein PHP62_04765 [Candidatus Moranbacteria bacterium]|nr:hypothetical protein [Candidatus Moranbacteria bacterium]